MCDVWQCVCTCVMNVGDVHVCLTVCVCVYMHVMCACELGKEMYGSVVYMDL